MHTIIFYVVAQYLELKRESIRMQELEKAFCRRPNENKGLAWHTAKQAIHQQRFAETFANGRHFWNHNMMIKQHRNMTWGYPLSTNTSIRISRVVTQFPRRWFIQVETRFCNSTAFAKYFFFWKIKPKAFYLDKKYPFNWSLNSYNNALWSVKMSMGCCIFSEKYDQEFIGPKQFERIETFLSRRLPGLCIFWALRVFLWQPKKHIISGLVVASLPNVRLYNMHEPKN